VFDFKMQVRRLTALLEEERDPDRAIDIVKIAKTAADLRERAELYTKAKFTLEYLDGVLGADEWHAASHVQNADLGSVVMGNVEAAALEWDPEVWEVRQ